MALSDVLDVLPWAVLFSLPLALIGSLVLRWLGERSLATTMTVLVLVPLIAELGGVLGVSGFMFNTILTTTLVCLLTALVTVPTAVLLGRSIARRSVWERQARQRERAAEASR